MYQLERQRSSKVFVQGIWSTPSMRLFYPQEKLNLAEIAPNDWSHYLEGCLFRMITAKSQGKFKWGRIESVNPKGPRLTVSGEDGKEQELRFGEITLDFNFPLSGSYNYKNSTLFF